MLSRGGLARSHSVFLALREGEQVANIDLEGACNVQEDEILGVIKGLMVAANTIAHNKGWWDQPREDGTCIALMHSELSEGLEALRKDLRSDHLPEFQGIEEELADVIIRVFDFAEERELNLAEALLAKMKFNVGREHRHGGKKF
jgi:NTP pyrophosphatase (non-canonical NTP hydrolase)